MRSPGRNRDTGTSRTVASAISKRAVLGCSAASSCRARPVRLRARSSRKRPNRTKPSSITGSLKKQGQPTCGQMSATTLAT